MNLLLAISTLMGVSDYPIPPQPLRQLYREAELVIVGKPGKTTKAEKAEGQWQSAKVALQLEKVLKGKCQSREITVYYSPYTICPTPDSYPEGKTVLVFLNWSEGCKGYIAPGLSYASKVLESDDLKVYLERIGELAKIPEEKRTEKPSDETVDWLVRCIEHPATSWEGAYEFFGATFWLKRTADDDPPKPVELKRLTKGQWKRILEAFVVSKSFGRGEDLVADMVVHIPDPRIDEVMRAQLELELTELELWRAERMMERFSFRLERKDLSNIIARYKALDEKAASAKLLLIEEFLKALRQK